MLTVPFSASSHGWDAFNLDGVVRFEPAALVIEYEGEWTKYDDDAKPIGTTAWGPATLVLGFADIVSIRLQRRFVRSSLILIQVRSIPALAGFPLAKGVQCEIPVRRRSRGDAEQLVREVQFAITDAALRGLLHEG